jgi:maleylpyruvate isomerase
VSARHDVELTREWLRAGTAHFTATLDGLTDDQLSGPSALPGWTRAHVVGHVARNAEALMRLATWAHTGVENPMYPEPGQRATDIEASATLPAPVLRADVAATAARLEEALDALTPDQWGATVRSALGRDIPAAEIPWMRIREMWLHAVDLAASATVHDLPAGVVDILIDDVAAVLSGKDGCPDLLLAPSDRPRTWRLGAGPDTADRPRVTAPATSVAGWLTGRVPSEELPAPDLPKWI